MRLRSNVQKRLADVRGEVKRLREHVRVLDEQVAFTQQVADDAATRALVSATPLADRDRRGAEDDLRRVRRERDEVAARIDALLAEQDTLLERLTGAPPGARDR